MKNSIFAIGIIVSVAVVVLFAVGATDKTYLGVNGSGVCDQNANFTGTITLGGVSTSITNDTTSATTCYPVIVADTSGHSKSMVSNTKLSFVPSTGLLTATGFSGPLTGVASGNTRTYSGLVGAMPATSTVHLGDIYIATDTGDAYISCATAADTTGWKKVN